MGEGGREDKKRKKARKRGNDVILFRKRSVV